MSTDLRTQIRHLANQVEADQEPVTADDVRLRVDDGDDTEPLIGVLPQVRRLSPGRRRWVAVLATVVVIALFGALALMLPGDEPVPPADTAPLPQGQTGEYVTSAVPDGFVVQRAGTLPSGLLYLRDVQGTWVPSDGGIFIDTPFDTRFGPPVDIEDRLETVLEAVPGSTRVELAGRTAVVFESTLEQWSTPLVWILGSDGEGGVFEMGTTGISREDALAVAAGVHRVPLSEYFELASQITWDLNFSEFNEGADYEIPALVTDLATNIQVAIGIETMRPLLAFASQGETVVTTETGEVVESDGEPIVSRVANLYVEAPKEAIEQLLQAFPTSELSPERREERVDAYVETLRGPVLSEEPYVMQAAPSPEPEFDVSQLGLELPIDPATSPDVVPGTLFEGLSDDVPIATAERPLIIVGTVREPGSDRPGVVALLWFTEERVICEGTSDGGGTGTSCGFEVQVRFGHSGESTGDRGGGGDLTFIVPLETSVVQIVTPSQNYWQRPIAGYVLVPYGERIERPTRIISFDTGGEEIGTWDTQSG